MCDDHSSSLTNENDFIILFITHEIKCTFAFFQVPASRLQSISMQIKDMMKHPIKTKPPRPLARNNLVNTGVDNILFPYLSGSQTDSQNRRCELGTW